MAEEAIQQPVIPAQPATTPAPQGQGGSDLDALKKQIAEITANLKIVSDTIAQQKSIDAESVKKLIAEAEATKAQAEATKAAEAEKANAETEKAKAETEKAKAEAAAKVEARKALRAKVVESKLKGVDESLLAALPDSDDEKALAEAADKIATALEGVRKAALPDVKNAKSDGGSPTPAVVTVGAGVSLPDGLAKFAGGMKSQ